MNQIHGETGITESSAQRVSALIILSRLLQDMSKETLAPHVKNISRALSSDNLLSLDDSSVRLQLTQAACQLVHTAKVRLLF